MIEMTLDVPKVKGRDTSLALRQKKPSFFIVRGRRFFNSLQRDVSAFLSILHGCGDEE